ncbi:MAG TPA: hypothetical protein VHD63_28155 [Ktedonobacteraceae bacterium]|nr:hypothetical protein [Ktedonobacteraceae bacterium]
MHRSCYQYQKRNGSRKETEEQANEEHIVKETNLFVTSEKQCEQIQGHHEKCELDSGEWLNAGDTVRTSDRQRKNDRRHQSAAA